MNKNEGIYRFEDNKFHITGAIILNEELKEWDCLIIDRKDREVTDMKDGFKDYFEAKKWIDEKMGSIRRTRSITIGKK